MTVLDELRVVNLGLIAGALVEPGPGLTVITGETGTGKTLLLASLRLLMGEPARKDSIGPAADEAEVHGRFRVGDDEIVAGRRVASGRSRAYLGGDMATATMLTERIAPMVEIVGQHDQITLTRASGVRSLVDGAFDDTGVAARAAYREAWERLRSLQDDRDRLGGDRRALERELEMCRFQAEEISAAGFEPGDESDLQASARRLRNAETIAAELESARAALDDDRGAAGRLADAVAALERLVRVDPEAGDLAAQATEVVELVDELGRAVADRAAELEHDPGSLDRIEGRVAELARLKRKYGASLADVLEFGQAAAARAAELEGLLGRAERLDDEVVAAHREVERAGADLAAARAEAAVRLEAGAREHLLELGFSDPVIEVAVESAAPTAAGADTVELRFSSDRGLTPGPVSRVASGGELSRLILALRLAAGVADVPVVAFDEVDAGVGGVTALAMGRKLGDLARDRQVLCVTHLPQVAAFAATHYRVVRDGASAAVELVEGEARIEELARMLSGLPDSDRGRLHAEELLATAASA